MIIITCVNINTCFLLLVRCSQFVVAKTDKSGLKTFASSPLRGMRMAMTQFHKSAVYREALKILVIPIFVSTAQVMEWGSHLNAKQHATLIQTQCALSDAARSECHPERKLRLAMQSQLMREAAQGFVRRWEFQERRFIGTSLSPLTQPRKCDRGTNK